MSKLVLIVEGKDRDVHALREELEFVVEKDDITGWPGEVTVSMEVTDET